MNAIPDTAIDRLAERILAKYWLSEQASKDKARTLLEDATMTIVSAGGKIVWEE